ncbi:tspB protein [Neisseria meningitidis]|nr:tspB protein [Neisseria meningitidis]
MGKPEEGMFDDIKIPQVTDEKTWDSDNFLPPNGVCPQPKSFNIWGRPVQISYEPLCVFMEKFVLPFYLDSLLCLPLSFSAL